MTRKFYIHKPFEIFMLNIFIFQVKQIMEEAVTRKFVHEESSSITSLCGNPHGNFVSEPV